jgi:hypothetical protein
MNKREDVLYLTLVDFFLQMLFLVMIALLFYIAIQQDSLKKLEAAAKISQQAKQWEDLAKKYNINSVQELLDKLTTLAPIDNLEQAKAAKEYMDKHGGLIKVAEAVKKIEDGQGKPPCVFVQEGDKKLPKSIATFSASDDSIRLISWQPEFATLATELGKGELMADTQWGLKSFVSSWYKVITLHPECRYTVTLQENTRFVEPRDRVQSIFYAQIRR